MVMNDVIAASERPAAAAGTNSLVPNASIAGPAR